LTERAWDPSRAEAAVAAIVAYAEAAAGEAGWPGHPHDDAAEPPSIGSLYLGSAGMIWALHDLGSSIDAAAMVSAAIDRYRASPDFAERAHPPSLWMGETGLLVVAARVGSPAADERRLRELVRENRQHPTWELMWGSPGTMLAARACGLGDEWSECRAPVEALGHDHRPMDTEPLWPAVADSRPGARLRRQRSRATRVRER